MKAKQLVRCKNCSRRIRRKGNRCFGCGAYVCPSCSITRGHHNGGVHWRYRDTGRWAN